MKIEELIQDIQDLRKKVGKYRIDASDLDLMVQDRNTGLFLELKGVVVCSNNEGDRIIQIQTRMPV